MNTDNLNTLIQRYEENFEYINNKENEEIFKWRAVRCFQDVWFSADAEVMSFSERFKAATKECSVLLDNGQVSPTNGIVKMAEQEPEEVERLFVEVLFADDSISTMAVEGELLLTLLAAFAQEDNRNRRMNVLWGVQKRLKDGTSVLYKRKCYDYRRNFKTKI